MWRAMGLWAQRLQLYAWRMFLGSWWCEKHFRRMRSRWDCRSPTVSIRLTPAPLRRRPFGGRLHSGRGDMPKHELGDEFQEWLHKDPIVPVDHALRRTDDPVGWHVAAFGREGVAGVVGCFVQTMRPQPVQMTH